MESKGKFVVIEGVDGAGKTTVARRAAAELARFGVVHISRKLVPDDNPFVAAQMRGLAQLLWHGAGGPEDNLLPPAYWLHLQAAWYAAFSRRVLRPALHNATTVLVDGWFFKLQAKLLLSGYEAAYVEEIFCEAAKPDETLLLDVDIGQVWERTRRFNPSEMGLHQGRASLGRESFVSFQSAAAANLRRFARQQHWTVVAVSPSDTVDETTARVTKQLRRALPHADDSQPGRSRSSATLGDGLSHS